MIILPMLMTDYSPASRNTRPFVQLNRWTLQYVLSNQNKIFWNHSSVFQATFKRTENRNVNFIIYSTGDTRLCTGLAPGSQAPDQEVSGVDADAHAGHAGPVHSLVQNVMKQTRI